MRLGFFTRAWIFSIPFIALVAIVLENDVNFAALRGTAIAAGIIYAIGAGLRWVFDGLRA